MLEKVLKIHWEIINIKDYKLQVELIIIILLFMLQMLKILMQNKNEFIKSITNHIIDKAEIIELFSKQNSNEL